MKDILKMLSCYCFENATNDEIIELLKIAKWESAKYSLQNYEQSPPGGTSVRPGKKWSHFARVIKLLFIVIKIINSI